MKTSHLKTPVVIGLTGGIGAGKSTITDHLLSRGFPVFDCDARVKELYADPAILKELTARYGDMGKDAKSTMSALAWKTPGIRKELEDLFGDQISVDLQVFIDSHVDHPAKLVVVDAPTLFEHGMQDIMDWIVVIHARPSLRRERVQARPGMTDEKFNAVVQSQISDAERFILADSIIVNEGTVELAQSQVDRIFNKLKRLING